MKTHRNTQWLAVAGFALFATVVPCLARSQDEKGHHDMETPGHSHEMSEIHGGTAVMTPSHHFEALFTEGAIHMYVYDGKQNPIVDPAKAGVRVTLEPKDGKPVELAMDYTAPDAAEGRTQGSFVAKHDFEGYEPGSMKAVFHVEGLSKKPIDFKTPVQISEEARYTCPMHPEVMADDPGDCPKCGMHLQRMGGMEAGGQDHGAMGHQEHHHD